MSDSHFGRGGFFDIPYPICTGHEIVGKVEAKGDEVKELQIGEKVMIGPFRNSCGECEYC